MNRTHLSAAPLVITHVLSWVAVGLICSRAPGQAKSPLERPGDAPQLKASQEAWIKDEARMIRVLVEESFAQSLERMADWNTTYYKLVIDVESSPALPESLKLIVYSRRFAKLLEETRGGPTGEHISAISSRLRSDLRRWRKLSADGQSLRAETNFLVRVGTDPGDLIVPLSFRINATILLVGHHSISTCLPLIVEAADTCGKDTNWAAVAYACDKIMTAIAEEEVSVEQKAVIEDYMHWKKTRPKSAFDSYKVIKLPSYRSSMRPFDRALSFDRLSPPPDYTEGTVQVELPPFYFVRVAPKLPEGYYDPKGNTEVAKRIVAFARRLTTGAPAKK